LLPPVASGNWISAAFSDVFPATVHPEGVRITFTRAYEVYVASLVDCVPPSHGSAVWSATVIFVSPVPDNVPAHAGRVFRKKRLRTSFSVEFPLDINSKIKGYR